jgi:hypothetical protein|tara:strand:+ start:194 stop:2038 length:1845 start_codon:yes stop_codon:yes gene_type:complete
MTVSSTITKSTGSGNGSLASFQYEFKIFSDDDITVIIRTDSTGAEVTKQKTTHYTVTNVGDSSGGNVVFTSGNIPASGETVVMLRSTERSQLTDYTPNDPFPAASHEDALDKLTFIAQEIEEELGRSIKVSKTNAISSSEFTTSATDRANKILSFDGSGDLTVTEGKVDTVTASASAVSAGGSPTASATYTASTGALALALGIPTGATGATGNSAGLQMTFNNSTSDADPGAGKLALNNGTLSSVSVMFFDDADDNGADISTFVQSFDDASNATAKGLIHIEKEGTASTFALYKVTGAVTDASGYTKVPVSHLVSNGTFSNSDGIRVDFSYSGNDGAGSLTELSGDTAPQLGGNLDVNGNLIKFGDSSSAGVDDTLEFGAGDDMQLYHDGTNSFLANKTGIMKIATETSGIAINIGHSTSETTIGDNLTITGDLTQGTSPVKVAGKETIYIPATAMYPNTTNGCASLAQVELSNGPEMKVLDFDASSDENAQFTVAFPNSWNEGTVTFQAFFTVTGTNTGTVAWGLSGVAIADNDSCDTAFGTNVVATAKAHSGTSNDINVTAESGAVTIAGSPSTSEFVFFQIMRDVSADDQSGDARLLGIKLFFTTDAKNDG